MLFYDAPTGNDIRYQMTTGIKVQENDMSTINMKLLRKAKDLFNKMIHNNFYLNYDKNV